MKYTKTVLILYGQQTEAFKDLKRFCEIKGVNYNTAKQKKLPFLVNGAMLCKEKKGESFEYIYRNDELIEIL